MSETVKTEVRGRVLVIRLEREEKRNAIDVELAEGIDDALNRLEDDPELWAGVITGTKSVFCAGTDMRAGVHSTDRGGQYGIIRRYRTKPLIAAVEGAALGGGFEVVLSCDLVVASKTAEFGLPDPRCNACIIQYTAKRDGFTKDRLIFCNAASNQGRRNLAVRISNDGGATWSDGKVLDSGPSAYSEITILKDGSLGVLYEPGYKEVRFARFTLEALTDGADTLSRPFVASPKTAP